MVLTNQWVNGLPSPKGILKNIQRCGRESLFKKNLPTRDLEAWRLTDLKRLENLLTLPLSPEKQFKSTTKSDSWPEQTNGSIRIVLGPQQSYESIKLPLGVRSLTSKEIEEHLVSTLNKNSRNQNWLIDINQATTNQVLAIKVGSENPISLELVMPSEKNTFTPTRVIIIMEESASLQLLQVALGSENSAHSHILEIHLAKNAELNHGFLALGGGDASCLAHLSVKQEAGSKYSLTSIQQGWFLSRLEPEIIQLKGQGKTKLQGLQVSTGEQQIATHSLVRFEGPNGYLSQLHKAAASQNSHSIFNGAIKVPQIAQQTNASQLSRNLLLSKHARIDTKPELEIVADDVKCSHGATISQLQEDELFYLQSRGIDSRQATSLLLKGYCQEIVDALPMNANRWNILKKILESIN
ncbi:Fe-S cluster assembly protein SufD [Prochlorococcus sp. MIT 1307]|uniref:Fe-S cluster assembly protein SufD n=1 Tax=Prochlorococcus sp. MIT 1307 TaxID=3096219 RepID=UPI002A74F8DD|nr:Fe-S cluster assembly protein SufD [Prochlorococcus sp. MIT 1307]